MSDALPDTFPQLRAAARRTGGYSRSVPHAEVREAVVHIDEQAKEIAALRARIAELEAAYEIVKATMLRHERSLPMAWFLSGRRGPRL
jgi:hypothetical protein